MQVSRRLNTVAAQVRSENLFIPWRSPLSSPSCDVLDLSELPRDWLSALPTGGLKLESLSNVPRTYMRSIEALRFDPANLSVRLVGSSGLEPPTSRLSGARSNHLSYEPIKLFRCISSLSPLFASLLFILRCLHHRVMSLTSVNFLEFGRGDSPLVEMMGFEPMTPCLQGRCSPN